MRRLIILLLSIPLFVQGQKPVINNFSPTHVEVNQTVTISGSNLAGARVFFGGVESIPTSTTANTIKVPVPAGASNDVIRVLNNNLMAQSSKKFFISFSGNDITNFSAEFLLSTDEVDGSDICLCDLNGDGLNDAVIAHNIIDNTANNLNSEITLFQNQSTPTNTLFSKVANINNNENNGGYTAVTCGDIDNDGKPDLVFTTSNSQNVKQIFVYKNTSGAGVSVAYQGGLSLRLPTSNGINRTPRKVKIADIDGDGKADLVVGNTLDSDNTIHIFRNTTNAGVISFNSPTEINVGSTKSPGSLEVADLNGDQLPDIAALPFQEGNNGIYILKNISGVGQIKFEVEQGILQNSSRDNLALGDFDNDGLIDLAATSGQLKRVRVYKNTSSNGDITFNFTAPATINISGSIPQGIDLGDLNGDGLLDIAVASINGDIYIVDNTSSGSITFGTPIKLSTTTLTRNISIGDVNGDAKPDLAFTHDIEKGATTDLGVFTNQNCVIPSISPVNLEFCFGDPFTLNATNSLGTTYAWEITAGSGPAITDVDSEASIQIDSGSPATIKVTITGENGCSESATATFNLLNGTPPSAPIISGSPADVVCVGDDFTLSTTAFDSYEWIKPDGSIVVTQSLSITEASFSDGGTYTLRTKDDGGCYSLESTVEVEVSDAPSVSIFNTELNNFCVGEDVELSVPDLGAGFSYKWLLDNSTELGTTTSITASQTGAYTVVVKDINTGCENTSDVKTLNALSVPVSIIDNNSQVCDGFPTDFTSSSTGQSGFTLLYHWEIENAANTVIHTSTLSSITDFTFPGIGSYDVTLTTGYDSTVVNGCGASTTIAVEVAAPPSIVFDQTEGVQKCQGDDLAVGINTPSSAAIASYYWALIDASSPNDTLDEVTTATALVSTPANVSTVWAVSTITTTTGCVVKDTLTVTNFVSDVDISSPDGFDLSNDTVTLENEFFINLQAVNLVSEIQWSPEELIDDPTATIVRIYPDQQEVIVTVTGTDANNCTVTSQVVIEIDIVRPKKTFSPNGDNKNDCWEVYNVSTSGCEVFIFDSRGRNILVSKEFDENCVWDGNFNGSPVPEGVYYYVIKCSGGINKSGSILLAR